MGYNIYFSEVSNGELNALENLKTPEELYRYRESRGYSRELMLYDIMDNSILFDYGKFNAFPEKLSLMQDILKNHSVPLFDESTLLGREYYDDVNSEHVLTDPEGAFDLMQKAYMDWTMESFNEFQKSPVKSRLLDLEYYLATCEYATAEDLWDNRYEDMIYHIEFIRNNFDWNNNSIIIFGC